MLIGAFRGDAGYDLLVYLHVLAAIVGFGAVVLNGLYGARVKALAQGGRPGEAAAVAEANERVSQIGTYFIYAVFVLGVLLILVSDDAWSFGDGWISGAIALYLVGLGIAHAVLKPTQHRLCGLLREMEAAGPPTGGPPPQAAEVARCGRRLATFGSTNDVVLVVILSLMVFKPGA